MPSFLVNYGGPGPQTSSMESSFDSILQQCKQKYHGTPEAIGFTVNGLDVTYYKIGVHRMIKVELPSSVQDDLNSPDEHVRSEARKLQRLFIKAQSRAGDFGTTKYKLTENNCVSAVANVLNIIDPFILGGVKKIVPFLLDSKIESYTSVSSLVHDALNPTPDLESSDEIIPTKKMYSGGVPHGFWQQAMTSVSEIKEKAKVKESDKVSVQETIDSSDDADKTPSTIVFKR